ncbi:MAG TPA: hypothetical protein GXX59_03405 [Syntrophomonadaceae bacterium]|nr:hypothetical protein [Syntrophomonadaceae bacterium]
MKGKLICIIGPDGTGKTTQANLLVDYLRQQSIDCEYKWLRFHHFFSLPVLAVARLMGLSRVETLESGKKIGYHEFHRSRLISTVYPCVLFIDTLFFMTLKVTIPIKLFGKTIVCDRFIYDTLVDLAISTGLNDSRVIKWYLLLIPHNCQIFMLYGDIATLRSRRDDVQFDKVLHKKVVIYGIISRKYSIPTLDSSLPVERIQNIIQKVL